MDDLEIQPLVGVGSIRFGMSRADVHDALGQPDDVHNQREWFLDGFAIDFDSDGTVEFMEFAESESFRVCFQGQALHELDADDAVALLSSSAPYDADAPEFGYTYIFPKLQVSLWRPVIPDEQQPDDDPTGRKFEAVGVGRAGYFDS